MATELRIENADAVGGKVTSAVRSMTAWYKRQREEIAIGRRVVREALAAGECEQDVADTVLAEIEQREQDLDAGWRNSSLRRHIEERGDPAGTQEAERRIRLAAPGGTTVVGARTTSTSTTTTAAALAGYAAVFNKVAVIGNYFEEQIAPAAFAEALKTSDVRCLFNHDADHVFGRSTANTLELSEDHHGLRFVSHLLSFDASSYALARRIDRGDISGCSFSFTVEEDKWRLAQRPGQLDQRIILKIGQLYDVGPVTYPAYPQTSVEAIFEKLPARSTAASDDDYDWQDDGYRGTVIDKARQRRLDEQLAALEQRDRARRPVSPARMHYLMSRLTAVQQRQDRTRERVDRLRKLAIGPVRELAANW